MAYIAFCPADLRVPDRDLVVYAVRAAVPGRIVDPAELRSVYDAAFEPRAHDTAAYDLGFAYADTYALHIGPGYGGAFKPGGVQTAPSSLAPSTSATS